jgi:hypothetical protein
MLERGCRNHHYAVARASLSQTPHDKLFAEAFGTVHAARGMLQALLPKSIWVRLFSVRPWTT